MGNVILSSLLFLYFTTRKASFDTPLVMLLDTILNDLLLYILLYNISIFHLLFTSFVSKFCIFIFMHNMYKYISIYIV